LANYLNKFKIYLKYFGEIIGDAKACGRAEELSGKRS